MKDLKNWKLWVGILLFIATALVIWRTETAKKEPVYQEVKVTRGNLQVKVISNGVVQPQNRLEIKPPIGGRIESILVKEGDPIEKGQVLAWMSSAERATLLDAASARGKQELAYWEDVFKPTPLIAPLTGLLIVRNVEPGQVVTAQDPVLVMSDHLIVRVQVDETDIARVENGQTAMIHLEAYPDENIAGHVDRISFESKIVNNVTIYEVDVLPDKVPDFMRSGMTAEVEFLVKRRDNVLLIPSVAVKKNGEKAIVEIPNPKSNGKVLEQEIVIGLTDGKQVEVVEGLQEGQVILMAEFQRPTSGQRPVSPLSPVPRGRSRR